MLTIEETAEARRALREFVDLTARLTTTAEDEAEVCAKMEGLFSILEEEVRARLLRV